MIVDMILFPSSFFSITKVDEDLQQEYDAVVSTGLFETVFFGYDKWFNEGELVLKDVPDKMHMAVYRGWMMKPEQLKKSFNRFMVKDFVKSVKGTEFPRFLYQS